jgi:STE24 endopeptidase
MARWLKGLQGPVMDMSLVALLILYVLVVSFQYSLRYLNLSHLRKFGNVIPPEFEGEIDQHLLRRSRDYTIENIRFGFFSSLFHHLVVLVFFFGGILDIYNSWIVSLNLSFIPSGLIFFFLLLYANRLLSIPFDLYATFRIEKKFGFSTMTPGLWLADLFKSLLLSALLTGLLLSGGLFLVHQSPGLWWLWVWGFFFLFSIFILYLSPYVIEPLFNKFEPINNAILEEKIRGLMEKVGIQVSRVFRMDASRRTRHTNAYFTGIGRVKRIVLYDTLLEKMENNEIVSVLAHEVGHWKKKHILKRIFVIETMALAGFYAAFRLLESDFLSTLFHLGEPTFFANVVILGFLGSIVLFPVTPLLNYYSRRHEREADRFAYELTEDAGSMIRVLVKLSKDNLSNLHPHPAYAAFHYSHPPAVERVQHIKGLSESGGRPPAP